MRRLLLSAFFIVVFTLGVAAQTPAKQKQVFLFVQVADSGTLLPKEGSPGNYVLTLNGVSPQTIYFSDRPARLAGHVATDAFLKGLGFSGKHPPNAAVEVANAAEDQDVIVVQLRRPRYDITKNTLQYDVTILRDATGGLAFYEKRRDMKLASQLSNITLFIDDCGNERVACSDNNGKVCGTTVVDFCWGPPTPLFPGPIPMGPPSPTCEPCVAYSVACTKAFPTCPVWKEVQ